MIIFQILKKYIFRKNRIINNKIDTLITQNNIKKEDKVENKNSKAIKTIYNFYPRKLVLDEAQIKVDEKKLKMIISSFI